MVVKKLVFLFVLSMLSSPLVRGAHLVGGDISYTCLGNNSYEITLRVYRDCGGSGAGFDANAVMSIYDINNNLIQTLQAPKGPTVAVAANPTNDPCIVTPPNLCTEYADYITQVTLPPLAGGYVISSQRCCRNNTISNVANSGTYGNTYTMQIPSMDTLCNNSPRIGLVAPTILCLDENINLSMAAVEGDGDSLYYELCEILAGGGQGGGGCSSTIPNPACPPPYTPVPLIAPYTPTDPMPTSTPLTIDGQTGLLTGVPNQTGQFVVGICVSEYRNGQFLSTVRLDYQFNVVSCGRPISNMVTPADDPTILCDGLTVKFISQSINNTSILWVFGDPTTLADTSTSPNTQYTYPNDGVYTVMLIANPGSSCSDTSMFDFNVKKLVDISIIYTGINCFEVQGFEFEPDGFWPANATFSWLISPGANISQWSGQKTPPITWGTPGTHQVELMLTWPPGCFDTLVQQISVSSLSLNVDAGPDQYIDEGETAQLGAFGGVDYFWYANLPAYFNNQFIQNPLTLPLHDSTTYIVEITDEFGCKGKDSLTIYLNPKAEPTNIMNVITPNADGHNDVLNLATLTGDLTCKFIVVDRWGKEMYSIDDYQNTWGGLSQGGDELPDGTYYFILQNGGDIIYKGPVTIIRSAN